MSKKLTDNELYCGHQEGEEEEKEHPNPKSKKGSQKESKGIFKSMMGGIKRVFGGKNKDVDEMTLLPRQQFEG